MRNWGCGGEVEQEKNVGVGEGDVVLFGVFSSSFQSILTGNALNYFSLCCLWFGCDIIGK